MTIESLLGMVLNIGLSREDFCSLTIDEFSEVMKCYEENQVALYKDRWERSRIIAFAAVAPHTKKIRKPQDLLKLPWDSQVRKKSNEETSKMSLEEHRKRMEELAKKWR